MKTVKLLLPLATLALVGLLIPLSEVVRPSASAAPPVALAPAAETVTILAADCTTPKVDFNLGETVCARISGAPLTNRNFRWINPCNGVEKDSTVVNSDPDADSFALPATNILIGNACFPRGTWQVNSNRTNDSSPQASARFRVHDPARPAADINISNTPDPSSVAAGSNVTFKFFLFSNGPDAATNAVFTMSVPANTTFVSTAAPAGWTCGAPSGGVVTCTNPSMPPADLVSGVNQMFSLTVTVPAGTINNTQVSSVGAFSSGVERLRGADDSSVATASVTSATSGPALGLGSGSSLVSESCGPANNIIDPGETVTVSFCIQNGGNQATTAALTGTLRAAYEVTNPPAAVNFGVIGVGATVCRNFTYTASNAECGTLSTPTIDLQDGANNRGTVPFVQFGLGGLSFIMGQQNAYNNFTCCAIAAPTVTAGQVLISEFRFHGSGGATDEFTELYNNTDAPLDISGHIIQSVTAGLVYTVPGALGSGTTMIPARGHYLTTGAGYSLATTAASDGSQNGIGDSSSIGFFGGATPTAANRIDSVGFNNTNPIYFEGTALTPSGGITANGQYSFVRRLASGRPQDTDDNAADFVFVSTTGGTFSTRVSILGAPGPENATSPVNRSNKIKATLLDPPPGSSAPPNRVRTLRVSCATCDNTKSNLGTLEIRRRFTNNTGAPLTRMRFHIVDITTLNNRVAAQADLRALNASGNFLLAVSVGGNVTVESLTLEPPSDATTNGGGLNSTLAAGTITGGTPIANGSHINVNFLLGVQLAGDFRFFVVVEALPGGPPFGPIKLGPVQGDGGSKSPRGSAKKSPRTN